MPPSRGARVCRWIEANLVHGEGDFYGRPFALTPEQKRFIWRAYEQNPDGSRKFRRVLKGMPKGGGKTELAAAIACYELGAEVTDSPLIPVAAASFEQANLLFGAARVMLSEGPLAPYFECYDTEILIKGKPGRMYRVAAAAGTNDGQRPTFFVADEVHEWYGPKERVHLVLSNGLAKRKGAWELNITTAGHDTDSLLGKMYAYGKRVESGEIDDPTFLFDWAEGAPNVEPTTREEWVAALASVYQGSPFADLDQIASRCMEIPFFEAARYYLNRWTQAEDSWLPAGAWSACNIGGFTFDKDLPLYAGVDAATKHDSTAVVFAQWQEDRLRTKALIWERPPDDDAWKLPIAEVENTLRDAFRSHDLKAVAYDPALFERSAQVLEDEGLPMLEIPQSASRMVPASQTLYQLIVEGRLAHDGNPVFARHIASAVAVEAHHGGWRLAKGKAKKKMDAAIALALAVSMATAEAAPPPSVPSFSLI